MPNGGCVMHAILFCRKRGAPIDYETELTSYNVRFPDGINHASANSLCGAFQIPFFDISSNDFSKVFTTDVSLVFPSRQNPNASRSWILHNGTHAYVLMDVRAQDTGFSADSFFKVCKSLNSG